MQVKHSAAVQAVAHHHGMDPAIAAGEATGELVAPFLILGVTVFALFVVYRAFRWFFRVTR